jgi:hypothetical protein
MQSLGSKTQSVELAKTDSEGKIKGRFLNKIFLVETCSNVFLDLIKGFVTLYYVSEY